MRSKTATIAIGAGAAMLLGGCTPIDTGLGATVKHNMAQHIINPDPEYAGTPVEGSSGDRAASALERYRKGTVKEPQTIRTTSGTGGSGGGASICSGGRSEEHTSELQYLLRTSYAVFCLKKKTEPS